MRHLSFTDKLLISANNALSTVFGGNPPAQRDNPANSQQQPELTEAESKQVAGLMRINHCGEVCAQALYQGQALTAKLPEVRHKMEQAAAEENDHLAWCEQRLTELGTHTSWFSGGWYALSFGIGAVAGKAGDKWSLGFVAETEHQVVNHLQSHIEQLPVNDTASRAILEQMKTDEQHHATVALEAGAATLPPPVRAMMGLMAKVMTKTVYYV